MIQPQDHSFLERKKGQAKQHFLKSLPDCRNRIAASNEQQDECLKSHITGASPFSMVPAWTAKEWGGGEKIQGCCHSFYVDRAFAWQVLEKARPPGHQRQPGIGPGQQKSCYLHSTDVEAWPGRRERRKQWSTGKLPWTKTQTLPQKHENPRKKNCMKIL